MIIVQRPCIIYLRYLRATNRTESFTPGPRRPIFNREGETTRRDPFGFVPPSQLRFNPHLVVPQQEMLPGHLCGNNDVFLKCIWLVVWTPLKNISQLGWLFPIYGKIKNVPNHQPGIFGRIMSGHLQSMDRHFACVPTNSSASKKKMAQAYRNGNKNRSMIET